MKLSNKFKMPNDITNLFLPSLNHGKVVIAIICRLSIVLPPLETWPGISLACLIIREETVIKSVNTECWQQVLPGENPVLPCQPCRTTYEYGNSISDTVIICNYVMRLNTPILDHFHSISVSSNCECELKGLNIYP